MREAVMSFIKEHYLLEKNKTVLVGVSGGPDSMALLHFLKSIRVEWNLKLVAVAVDHQLRGNESKQDLNYVEKMCNSWEIKFIGTSVNVPSYKKEHRLGTQVAARKMRYQVFSEQMESFEADYLALGHHGDDQLETMLMGLVRSANPTRLAGIPVRRQFATGEIIRPLLGVTKQDIENYCMKHGIVPRRDPSNDETDYTRNYFRKYVLPLLKDKNNNIHTTVQHLSEVLKMDEQYLSNEAKKLIESVVEFDKTNKQVSFKIDEFQTHPIALQRRFLHLILKYLYDDMPKNLSYIHEEQFFALLNSHKANGKLDFPHDLKMEKAYQQLSFYFQRSVPNTYCFHELLNVPGEVVLPNGATISAFYTNDPHDQSLDTYVCGKNEISLPLHIRTRQSGDRMSWQGLAGSKKIKDIFIDEKVPLTIRDKWPIVTDNNGEILWLIGLRKKQSKQLANNSYIKVYYEKGKA